MSHLLTEDQIADRLNRAYRPGVIASTDGYAELYASVPLQCAAVLIPFARCEDEWHIVFTRRTDTVQKHKGQVAFPGGSCNAGETSPETTALREAMEEIGLNPADVRLLGRLNDIITITRYRVSPVVGVIPWPYPFQPAAGEVARVFTIPLPWLANRRNWKEQPFTPDGIRRPFPVVLYAPYDGEVLWGASARIILNLIAVLGI